MLAGDGFEIRAVMPFWGGSVMRAELVPADGGAPVLLEPEPGTRAARRAKFEREHPRLYASRHVVKGAAQVAIAIIGLTFLLRFLPAIPLAGHRPAVDPAAEHRPAGPPVPNIDLPTSRSPAGSRRSLQTKQYWLPILIGIFLANAELQRRKRRNVERDDRAGDPARPGTGAPE